MDIFLPLIFSNVVKQHVVEYDKLRFQPEIICNALCEKVYQKMYLFFTTNVKTVYTRIKRKYNNMKQTYTYKFTCPFGSFHRASGNLCNLFSSNCLQMY